MRKGRTPQERHRRFSVAALAVMAITGMDGRKRLMSRAVVPLSVEAMMALAFRSRASSQAAKLMASEMESRKACS